jgi:tetratricopeptide (TPR) repeat protein
MEKYLNSFKQRAEHSKSAMETGDHFKNGANPKSLTSRRNFLQKGIFKSLICLAAFMWLTGVAQIYAQQNDGEELRRHIRYAQTAYNSGKYQNALAEYQTALELAPNYPELYKAIGDVYEKLAATADLKAAIEHYKRYVEFAPDAPDVRQIRDKIYDLEYLLNEQEKQDRILDDLSGEWVAMDNITITKLEKDSSIRFNSDFVFQIDEIQKSGKYRVTMKPEGSRYYSADLIEKTVHIVPKENAFTFTFADATVHTPNSAGYGVGRLLGRALGSAMGSDWIGDLTDIAMSAAQENDLPSSTQTAYTFALRYEEGKLVGMVNVVGKFADPTRQQTTGNEIYEITFVKKDDGFRELLVATIEGKPDVISDLKAASLITNGSTKFKDKWGKKLSQKEIAGKLYSLDPQLGKAYNKAKNTETVMMITAIASIPPLLAGEWLWLSGGELKTTGRTMCLSSLAVAIVSFSIGIPASSKKIRLINQYNEQILQQHKNKPTTELRFGITSSGGGGLTFNF